MNENAPYLVSIHRACNLTWKRYQTLKLFFGGNFKKAFSARIEDWSAAGVDKIGIEKFFSSSVIPEQEMEKLKACQAKILIYGEPDFPLVLNHIFQPPVLLFVRGNIILNDFPAIGVVGSRRVTGYGKTTLELLLGPVVEQGVTTVSGLAFGVDKLIHELSISRNQRTLAVLGNGIERIYPASHRNLADRILENGAIISEYLPGVEPRPEYFPQRNRIVSGLSKAVVLVEAAEKSGTLITAAWANEQGRDIFAIPGSVFSPQSKGTNQLIAQGLATALVDSDQIQSLFVKSSRSPAFKLEDVAPIDRSILECLARESPLHGDEIIRRVSFPASVISSHLMLLEVRGWIKDTGQQIYTKVL